MHRIFGATFALAAALAATRASGAAPAPRTPQHYEGIFAIPGATTEATATLSVATVGRLEAMLDLVERSGGAAIRDYDVEMTKRLHLIVISDDFSTFAHLHPELEPDGHFKLDVRVPKAGRYYIYADGEPSGLGKSVFRFSVPFGDAPNRAPQIAATTATAVALPYSVTLDSLHLNVDAPTSIGVRIEEHGRTANDLRPYLGGAAHAVFIDARTLAYLHVHPVPGDGTATSAMPGMPGMAAMRGMSAKTGALSEDMADLPAGAKVPGTMRLHVAAVPAGRYKLWLQFRGGNSLHVASFVLTAP